MSVDPRRLEIVTPEDFVLPDGGLHARWPDKPLEQEMRLQKYKLYAAVAFARANGINKVVIDSPMPRIGIVTTGKSYLDVRQALEDLGIDEALAAQIGLRGTQTRNELRTWTEKWYGSLPKVLEEVLIRRRKSAPSSKTKSKSNFIIVARRCALRASLGKFDEADDWILPSTGELTAGAYRAGSSRIRIRPYHSSPHIRQRLAFLEAKEAALARPREVLERVPHYCSGCPHNTSTVVPEGSRAMAGIGCHYMATWMDRSTDTFTQMGGEGVTWIGQAPFTETQHVFRI